MIWSIRDVLICCFDIYILNDLEKSFFDYRKYSFKVYLFIYVGISIIIWSINNLSIISINMIGIPICYIFFSILAFQGSVWKKIILSYCYYMLEVAPKFIFAIATNVYRVYEKTVVFENEIEKTILLILIKVFMFLFVKCIGRNVNRQVMYNKTLIIVLLLPVATIVMLGSIYYVQVPLEDINRIMLSVSIVLLLLTNISIFIICDRLVENAEKTQKLERLYQKSKAKNNNYKYLYKVVEEHETFLHDINRFVQTSGRLLLKGEIEEAVTILEHIGIRIKNIYEYKYCSDILLNSILSERKFMADNKQIRFEVEIDPAISVKFIDDLDLISIIGNLLDNAIEAAESVKSSPFVRCKLYMANNGNFLVMEFQNNFLFPPKMGKEGYISSKKDSGNHGVGLHTVEKLVKQYGGVMRIQINEDKFGVNIAISAQ